MNAGSLGEATGEKWHATTDSGEKFGTNEPKDEVVTAYRCISCGFIELLVEPSSQIYSPTVQRM